MDKYHGGNRMPEEENVIKVDHYNGVEISEYKGTYSLLALDKGGQAWYWKKCLPNFYDKEKGKRRFKTEAEKPEPVKVIIGEGEQAIKVLETAIIKIRGMMQRGG